MAAQLAGALEIQMSMGIARIASDIAQAKGIVGQGMKSIESSVAMAKQALGALGIGLGVGALIAFTKNVIDGTAKLDDMAEMTGATVEALSALRQVARVSGQDFDAVGQAMTKLAKNLAGVDDEGKGAGKALAAIGLDLDKIKGMKADEQMQTIAKAMNQFEDGTGKAAVAQVLLGKSGAALLPYLKDLSEWGKLNATVTAQQAAEAEKLQKSWNRLKSDMQDSAASVANDLIPMFSAVIGELVAMQKGADGAASSFNPLTEAFRAALVLGGNVAFALHGVGVEIGGIAAQLAALARGDLKAFSAIGSMMREDAANARATFDVWENKILVLGTATTAETAKTVEATKKKLEFSSAADKAKDAYIAIAKRAADFIQALEKEAAQYGMTAIQKKIADAVTVASTLKTEKEREAVLKAADAVADKMQAEIDKKKVDEEKLALAKATEKAIYDEAKAYEDSVNGAMKAHADAQQNSIKSYGDLIDKLEQETATMLMTSNERERYIALKQLDRERTTGLIASEDDYLARLREITAALNKRDAATKTLDDMKAQADMWKTIDDTARQTFVSILNSGKSAFDRLRDTLKNGLYALLYEITLKRWLINIAASVSGTGAATQAFGATATSGGGSFLGSAAGSMFGAAGAVGSIGAGGMVTTAAPVYASALEGGAMLAGAETASIASGAGASSALAAIPVYGWIAIAAIAAYAYFSKQGGGPKVGEYGYANASGYVNPTTMSGGDQLGNRNAALGIYSDAQTLAALAGHAGALAALNINQGYILDPQGTSRGQAGRDIFLNGQMISSNQASLGSNDAAGAASLLGKLNDSELMALVVAMADPKLTAAAEALQSLYGNLTSSLPTYLQYQAAQKSLSDSLMTDAEKVADAQKQLTENGLPNTIAGFKSLLDSLDPINIASQVTIERMTALRPALDLVAQAADAAAAETKRLADEQAAATAAAAAEAARVVAQTDATRAQWQQRLDLMTGAITERDIELAGVTDEATQAIMRQIYAMQDQRAAADAAAQALTESSAALATAVANQTAAANAVAAAAEQASRQETAALYAAHRDTLSAATQAASAAMAAVTRAVQAASAPITATINQLTALSSALKSSLSGLMPLERSAAQVQINSALLIARSGGPLPTAAQLQPALAAIAQPSQGLYSSFADYQRDFLMTANDIAELAKIADSQTSEQQTALDVLMEQAATAQSQLDALNGIDNSVGTVADAIAALTRSISAVGLARDVVAADTVAAAQDAAARAAADALALANAKAAADAAVLAAEAARAAASSAVVRQLYAGNATATAYNPTGPDPEAINYWNAVITTIGLSAVAGGEFAKQVSDYAAIHPIPGHAGGGIASGWSMVGEHGPEVANFTQPARIYTASQTREMMGSAANDEMLLEMKGMRKDMAAAKAEIIEIRKSNQQMWLIAEKQDNDGAPTYAVAAP